MILNILHRKIPVFLLVALLCGHSFGEIRRRTELKEAEALLASQEKLKVFQKELDQIKIDRWQDKRNSVAKKEAYQEIWSELRRSVEKMQREQSQREESFLRLENQRSSFEKEKEEAVLRHKEFGTLMADKLMELDKDLASGWPDGRDQALAENKELQKSLDKAAYKANESHIQRVFSEQKRQFALGESREIKRKTFPVLGIAAAQNKASSNTTHMVAGYEIRLGTVYKAFVSTESDDAVILGKTGRVDAKSWDWIEDLKSGIRDNLKASSFTISNDDKNVAMFIPIDVMLRKATGAGFTGGMESTFWKDLKKEMAGVGFTLYLIIPLMGIGLILVVQKGILFSIKGRHGKKFAKRVMALVEKEQYDKARELCKKSKGSLPIALNAILKRRNGKRQDAEDRVYEILLHETSALEKNVGTVNILAASAPLMGLLGTVSGMVNLFGAITLHGTSDPKIMASGIAEALLSTKWGLLAAIPLLLIYNYLSNRSEEIVSDLEKYSTQMVNTLFGAPDTESPQVLKEAHVDELSGKA